MQKTEKEYNLKAKLNDKNLQALEKAETVDGELGLATSSMMLANDSATVKAEVPSLDKLKELAKTCRIAYVFILRLPHMDTYILVCIYICVV